MPTWRPWQIKGPKPDFNRNRQFGKIFVLFEIVIAHFFKMHSSYELTTIGAKEQTSFFLKGDSLHCWTNKKKKKKKKKQY